MGLAIWAWPYGFGHMGLVIPVDTLVPIWPAHVGPSVLALCAVESAVTVGRSFLASGLLEGHSKVMTVRLEVPAFIQA